MATKKNAGVDHPYRQNTYETKLVRFADFSTIVMEYSATTNAPCPEFEERTLCCEQ